MPPPFEMKEQESIDGTYETFVRMLRLRRIEVRQIRFRLCGAKFEYIPSQSKVSAAVVRGGRIVKLDLFKEMLFQAKAQVSSPVVAAIRVTGNGEYSSRLTFDAGSGQRSKCHRASLP